MVIQIDANDHSFHNSDHIFVDTNIWIYLFYPTNNNDYGYSSVFQNMLDKEVQFYTTEQVLSEYVNRIVQSEFVRFKDNQTRRVTYKQDFRPTSEYKDAYGMAMNSIHEDILPIAKIVSLSSKEITDCCEQYQMLDFNDNLYLNLCVKNNFSIISHDRDFENVNEEFILYRNIN